MMAKASLVHTTNIIPIYTEDDIFLENPAVGYPHSMLATFCKEYNAGFSGVSCFWSHGDLNSNMTVLDNE